MSLIKKLDAVALETTYTQSFEQAVKISDGALVAFDWLKGASTSLEYKVDVVTTDDQGADYVMPLIAEASLTTQGRVRLPVSCLLADEKIIVSFKCTGTLGASVTAYSEVNALKIN